MADFDIDSDLVRKLSALLDETGLFELEFADGEKRIRVSRAGPPAPAFAATNFPIEPKPADPTPTPSGIRPPGVVTAPMVGTVYIAPEPGADPFVRVGDTVGEGQTLLLIEAMKTYNPIRAPIAGRVARILVTDTTPVEFGEELIILE